MSWPLILRIVAWVAALAILAAAALYLWALNAFTEGTFYSRWQRRIKHARTHTVLDRPLVIDGVLFPAETEIAWEDASHTRMVGARRAVPAEILGVRTSYLRRDSEGGWIISMDGARELDGWPCGEGQIQLYAAGRLQDCELSRTTSWRGWTLPVGTSVNPLPSINALRLTLLFVSPSDMPLESPLVGKLSWGTILNDDGSPSATGYDREAPLRVAGQELSGDVRWEYDPATLGMGRERPPVTVSGFVYDPARRHVVLPWPGSGQGPGPAARGEGGR